jgi:hypothetical protein
MNIVWEIALQAVEIINLVVGILGMTLSLLMLFAPGVARNLSGVFNRQVDTDRKLSFLDRSFASEGLIYGHPLIIGGCLSAGAAFALVFLFSTFDARQFALVFFGPGFHALSGEIIFQTVGWVARIGCLLGLLAGVCLMVAPERMRAIDRRLNTRYETGEWIDRLQRSTHSLDSVFFRYPIPFGLLGGSISCLLIVLSILNLLR